MEFIFWFSMFHTHCHHVNFKQLQYKIKTTDIDTFLIENYLGLIKNFSPNAKRNLIKKLTKTLTLNFSEKEKSVKDAFGAWESKKSAE